VVLALMLLPWLALSWPAPFVVCGSLEIARQLWVAFDWLEM
jgi:hypothetical protein